MDCEDDVHFVVNVDTTRTKLQTWIDKLSEVDRRKLAAFQLEFPDVEFTAAKYWHLRRERSGLVGDGEIGV